MSKDAIAAGLTGEWKNAIHSAAAAARVVVLGATDMGKSTFIGQVAAAGPPGRRVIDLDPGQKMIGPPGTLTLGRLEPRLLERFVFLGSTSSSSIGAIARAGAELADVAGRFIANTSGFVSGLGARLQAATVASLKPDLIIEIAADLEAAPVIRPALGGAPLIRLPRSPAAGRKSAAARARLRQQAFDAALADAIMLTLPRRGLGFEPGVPAPFVDARRPVCALADAAGDDLTYGVLVTVEADALIVFAPTPRRPVQTLRLGKIWAEPGPEGGWRLQEKLSPTWASQPA